MNVAAVEGKARGQEGQKGRQRKICDHLPLVPWVVCRISHSREEFQDLISVGCIGLIKAVDTYDAERQNRFSTYACRCIANEVRMEQRKSRQNQRLRERLLVLGQQKESSWENEPLERYLLQEQLEQVLSCLTAPERRVILGRYGLSRCGGATQEELARSLGVSQSYVSRLERRAKKKLYQTWFQGRQ